MLKPFLLFLTLLSISFGVINAREPVVSITTTYANQGSYVSDYNSEFKLRKPEDGSQTWTARCFNNNNSAWPDIRCGSKTAATTATITTDFTIAAPVNNVEIEISRYKTGSSNRMTSMALLVSANADMSDSEVYQADISLLPTTTGTPVTFYFPIENSRENMYYQLRIEMPKVSSAGVFSVNSLKYFAPGLEDEEGVSVASLDFADKDGILNAYADSGTIAPGSEYGESGTNNLNDASFYVGDVFVSFSKGDGTIQPRWWEDKTITPELRLNPGNIISFGVAKSSCKLLKVKFMQGTVKDSYYNSIDADATTNLGESEFADKTWIAPETGDVKNLTLKFKGDYCRCGSIDIFYYDEDSGYSGVETISLDNNSFDGPVEYFNLHGMKIDAQNIVPGIYIKRQGSKVAKTIVR